MLVSVRKIMYRTLNLKTMISSHSMHDWTCDAPICTTRSMLLLARCDDLVLVGNFPLQGEQPLCYTISGLYPQDSSSLRPFPVLLSALRVGSVPALLMVGVVQPPLDFLPIIDFVCACSHGNHGDRSHDPQKIRFFCVESDASHI